MLFSLKPNLIVLTIIFLMLVGFINSSDAITFEVFPSDTEDDVSEGYIYHTAYVKTDKPIYHISWYIDDEWVYGQTLDSTTSEAWFSPGDRISGSIRGNEYKIGARVWEWDDRHGFFRSHTDTYHLTVYKPVVESGYSTEYPHIYGHAELSRHYYSHPYVIVEWHVYANTSYMGTEKWKYNVKTEFKNTVKDFYKGQQNQDKEELGSNPLGTLTKENRTFSESGSIYNSIEDGEHGFQYECEAYIRLTVDDGRNPDYHWFFTETNELGSPNLE